MISRIVAASLVATKHSTKGLKTFVVNVKHDMADIERKRAEREEFEEFKRAKARAEAK